MRLSEESAAPRVAPVYDILDCGPRNRFAANGKLVHNSGGDKQNPQNLNRYDPRDPTSGALRRSWVAPKGHVFVVVDLSQIEARVLAYWAGQDDLVGAFRNKVDPYCHMATDIFGRTITKEDDAERKVGKSVTLGCGFGMGWLAFQANLRVGFLGMPPIVFDMEYVEKLGVDVKAVLSKRVGRGSDTVYSEAVKSKPMHVDLRSHLIHCAVTYYVIDLYRKNNRAIAGLWRECQGALDRIVSRAPITVGCHDLVKTTEAGLLLPNGMSIQYHELRKSKGEYSYLSRERPAERAKIYGGKIAENGTQALARIILGEQMLEMRSEIPLVSSTHDEAIGIVPEHHGEDALAFMTGIMEKPPAWAPDLPLAAEGGFDRCYALCEK